MTSSGEQLFLDAVERMPSLLKALREAPAFCVADHPTIPKLPGIYLFSEHDTPIYVGQSRNLKNRLANHTRTTSRENQASFAFNLAKRESGVAGLDLKRTRALLESDPTFATHFSAARTRVAAMHVQFIELDDPITRTLFEVYAALALDTAEFNSFETH
jgi:hypothetical protein